MLYSLRKSRICYVKIASVIYSKMIHNSLSETTDRDILKSHILSLGDIGYPAISHFNRWRDLLFPYIQSGTPVVAWLSINLVNCI